MAKVKAKSQKVIHKANTSPKKPARSFLDVKEDTNKNPNYYTDASKYAKEYYGETLYYTTKFDNDWN